jgi:hypothetical protein
MQQVEIADRSIAESCFGPRDVRRSGRLRVLSGHQRSLPAVTSLVRDHVDPSVYRFGEVATPGRVAPLDDFDCVRALGRILDARRDSTSISWLPYRYHQRPPPAESRSVEQVLINAAVAFDQRPAGSKATGRPGRSNPDVARNPDSMNSSEFAVGASANPPSVSRRSR